jgi:tRNA (guanine-N7-)-methyltransferase
MGTGHIPPPHRPVRTFHPRRGRLGPTRTAVIAERLPHYQIRLPYEVRADCPTMVELGCGDGTATIALALRHPDVHVIAADVHTPGLATLIQHLDAKDITNVSIFVGDALDLLEQLPGDTIAGINVFFPDPWPKARHAPRRLYNAGFFDTAARVMEPGAVVHLATDIAEYAQAVRDRLADDMRFAPVKPSDVPPRPVTPFERKGLAAGRVPTDLAWSRTHAPSKESGDSDYAAGVDC